MESAGRFRVCEMLPKPGGRSCAHLAAVPAGEQDQHRAGGDGRPQAPLVLAEGLLAMAQQLAGNVLCGVVPGLGTEHRHLVPLCVSLPSNSSKRFSQFPSSSAF